MALNEKDRTLEISLPYEWRRLLIYVGKRGDSYDRFMDLCRHKVPYGYNLLYLPNLIRSLGPPIMGYMFPGQQERFNADAFYSRVREMAGLNDEETGILYQYLGKVYFHPVDGFRKMGKFLGDFASLVETLKSTNFSPVSRTSKRDTCCSVFIPSREFVDEELECSIIEVGSADVMGSVDETAISEEPIDPRTEEILRAWRDLEKRYGLSIDELRKILGYTIKRSRLLISRRGKIVLQDYEGSPEVKLDSLTKAVYIFYLRHPEGVRLKDLQLYEKEVFDIYMKITSRDDIDAIRNSVSAHLDPFSNNLNVSVSRIKRAFLDIVDESIAQLYYITGFSGGIRIVTLDRDFVIWE